MQRWRVSYWAIYHEARARFGFTDHEARSFYRPFRDAVVEYGERPSRAGMIRHPKLVTEAARSIVLAEAAEEPTPEAIAVREEIEEELAEAPEEYEEWEITATTKGHTPRRR